MKAIILAGGRGTRLGDVTATTPKPLVQVAGKSILERMISNILSLGIKDICLVTGQLEEQIKDFLRETYPEITFTIIRNHEYELTNTGYGLLLTKDFVGDDAFIKFDGDVVFEKALLEKLISDPHDTALCIDRNINLEAEEVKAITTPDGKVLEVGKKLDPHRSTGESIGIEKIGKDAAKVLFEELGRLMEDKANWKEYYDDSYTTLVNKGVPFYAVDITGLQWVEIDTPVDYALAEKIFTPSN